MRQPSIGRAATEPGYSDDGTWAGLQTDWGEGEYEGENRPPFPQGPFLHLRRLLVVLGRRFHVIRNCVTRGVSLALRIVLKGLLGQQWTVADVHVQQSVANPPIIPKSLFLYFQLLFLFLFCVY